MIVRTAADSLRTLTAIVTLVYCHAKSSIVFKKAIDVRFELAEAVSHDCQLALYGRRDGAVEDALGSARTRKETGWGLCWVSVLV